MATKFEIRFDEHQLDIIRDSLEAARRREVLSLDDSDEALNMLKLMDDLDPEAINDFTA